MNTDVADRDPLHLDIVQASIGLYTPVAPEETILPLIIATPFICQSSVVHPCFVPASAIFIPAHMMALADLAGYWTKVPRAVYNQHQS